MNLVWATVTATDDLYCQVEVDGREGAARAIAYPDLVGMVATGDRVLLNTTAIDLKLSTGGDHFIVARAGGAEKPSGIALSNPSGGHLMKLRYTPLQRDVLAVEAPEAPTHAIMKNATSLEGVAVVCCGLHSQMPLVAAAIKATAPHLRVGYVMTDQAALHMGYSKMVKQAVAQGLVDVTVSTGQAIGGDIEAINLYSGLLAACHVGGCDVIVVAIGPGVAGTSTPFGHGGVAQGEAVNAAFALGGRPVIALRMSFADERERHQGISHHSLSVLGTIALAPAVIAIPYLADARQQLQIDEQLEGLSCHVDHQGVFFDEPVFDPAWLGDIVVTTMGRGFADDPIFFEAAAAAGVVAAQIGAHAAEDAIQAFADERKQSAETNACAPQACASCGLSCPSKQMDSNSKDG